MTVNENLMTRLRQLLGEPLRSVEGLLFASPGESVPSLNNLDQLQVMFGKDSVRCRCSNDGEAMIIDRSDFNSIDLGEYGELLRTDLFCHSMFNTLVDARLRKVSVLTSYDGNFVIGCVFEFKEGALIICNWGDELKVWPSIPQTLFADEKIQIVPV